MELVLINVTKEKLWSMENVLLALLINVRSVTTLLKNVLNVSQDLVLILLMLMEPAFNLVVKDGSIITEFVTNALIIVVNASTKKNALNVKKDMYYKTVNVLLDVSLVSFKEI